MTNTQLHTALQLVATACDGAVARDGVGFSGSDASHGSWLAASDPQAWGPDELSTAAWLVNKYRGQIVSQDVTLPEFLERDQGAWDRQLAQIRHARKEAARTEAARLRAAVQHLESERRAARTPEEAARDNHGAVDLENSRLRAMDPLTGRTSWPRVEACWAMPGRVYARSPARSPVNAAVRVKAVKLTGSNSTTLGRAARPAAVPAGCPAGNASARERAGRTANRCWVLQSGVAWPIGTFTLSSFGRQFS
ncbi:hypothetical protein Q0M94_06535 [Deinococcus radiomollis]|uniref:hypothetical protein n=1 Tax=Deinococcus radiomollis TaxID=468916 RepID=UPI003892466F